MNYELYWKKMADKNGEVNSNYGYQWQRKRQLNQMILKLKLDKDTRQACISIYDGKEFDDYNKEKECTNHIISCRGNRSN